MRVLIPLCLLLSLTACGTERLVEKPVIVEVTTVEWRPIPADMTAPCELSAILDGMTYGDALQNWAADRAAVEACNAKLAAIRSLGDPGEQGAD